MRRRRRHKTRRTSRRFRQTVRYIRRFLLVAALLLVLDGLYVAYRLATTVPDLDSTLSASRTALTRGDLDAAEIAFGRLESLSSAFSSAARHPSVRFLSVMPFIGNDADALRALADASELSARAGTLGIDGGRALGVTPSRPYGEVFVGGRVDVQKIQKARVYVAAAAERLAEAEKRMDVPPPDLEGLTAAFAEAETEVHDAASSASRAAAAFDVLPDVLGVRGPRRYLLAFQALGEARATGGLLGSWGTLRVEAGEIRLTEFEGVEEGFPTTGGGPPVEAPGWFRSTYGSQSALVQSQQTNISPSFPIVSDVWLQMHRETAGTVHDGVAAMDPVALSMMMRGMPPVRAPGGEMLSADEIVEAMSVRSYTFEQDADQQEYLGGIVRAFWDHVFEGRFEPRPFIEGVIEAVNSHHLKFYSATETEQPVLLRAGVSGAEWVSEPNAQMVFHNNYGANKLDYYFEKNIRSTFVFESPEEMRATTTVSFKNSTPSDSPLLDVGLTRGGRNVFVANVLAPDEATFDTASYDGDRQEPNAFVDGGHPVTSHAAELLGGQQAAYEVTYRAPTHISGDEVTFSFVPQPAITPDAFRVEFVAPPGYVFTEPGDSREPKERVVVSGRLEETTEVRLRLVED